MKKRPAGGVVVDIAEQHPQRGLGTRMSPNNLVTPHLYKNLYVPQP